MIHPTGFPGSIDVFDHGLGSYLAFILRTDRKNVMMLFVDFFGGWGRIPLLFCIYWFVIRYPICRVQLLFCTGSVVVVARPRWSLPALGSSFNSVDGHSPLFSGTCPRNGW